MKAILLSTLFLTFTCTAQDSYQIAYNVLENPQADDYEIYIMDMEGKNPRNLTDNPAVDWVYYAYENKIYFLSDRDACPRCFYLYEMEVSTETIRKITDFQLADSWFSSRNGGTEFVVKPVKSDFIGVYIINLQGEIVDHIPIDLPYMNDPAFSPDGTKIVFRGANKTSPRELGFIDELYVLDLEPRTMQKITAHPEADENTPWRGYLAAAPRWRKDGIITFASKRGRNYDIYEIHADGTGLKAVTEKENNQVFHDWSIDGHLIFEASMNNHDGYELYRKSPSGKTEQLTNDKIEQYAPVFVKMN